jgi:endoglucanase
MAVARGFHVITNMHHDSTGWADVTQPGANIKQIQEKFRATWVQIATKLACKSSAVAFEPINEPPATTEAHGALINQFNDLFLSALKESGGWNTKRVVTLMGGGMDGPKTTLWFKRPKDISNPWAIQYHYYSPCRFPDFISLMPKNHFANG